MPRMEQYPVRKIEKPIDWCVTVPGSKSMTNRALLMAALSDGTVTLDGVLFSDDSRHFISSLTALGFDVLVEEEKRRVTVKGESRKKKQRLMLEVQEQPPDF